MTEQTPARLDGPSSRDVSTISYTQETQHDDVLDLRDLIRKLWRRKKLILATIILITGLVAVNVFQITPQYQASSEILIEGRNARIVDIEGVIGSLNTDNSSIESEIQIMTSRDLAAEVIGLLNLIDDPEFNPGLKEPSSYQQILTQLNPLQYVSEVMAYIRPPQEAMPATEEERLANRRARVIDTFLGKVSVRPVGRSRVVRLTARSASPQQAARIANALAETYVENQIEEKFAAVHRATSWLNEQVAELRERLQVSEAAVERFRAFSGLTEGADSTVIRQQLSELNSRLIIARSDLAESEARLNQVTVTANQDRAYAVSEVLNNPLIQSLRAQEARLASERADLFNEYGPQHPRIIRKNAELVDIRGNIVTEVQRITEGLRNEAEVARSRVRSLQEDLRALERLASDQATADIELRQLEREAEADRAILETFLSRLRETVAQDGLQDADSRIISTADVPSTPSSPNKKLSLTIAGIFASVLGIALALLLEHLDKGFRTSEQVEQAIGVGAMAMVPQVRGGGRRRVEDYVVRRPTSGFSESLRTIHTAVMLSNVDSSPKTVLFTSALPKEGKTTVVLCLGRLLAMSGRRIVTLDLDLRHPRLHKYLRVDLSPGIIEFMDGDASLEDIIRTDERTGLNFITAGSGSANKQDFLSSERMGRLLEGLAKSYDLTLLDSPPVQAVSDAQILARLADKTVFLTRWGKTPREVAIACLKRLHETGADLAGIALTIVNIRKHAQYGYRDQGYYYSAVQKYYRS